MNEVQQNLQAPLQAGTKKYTYNFTHSDPNYSLVFAVFNVIFSLVGVYLLVLGAIQQTDLWLSLLVLVCTAIPFHSLANIFLDHVFPIKSGIFKVKAKYVNVPHYGYGGNHAAVLTSFAANYLYRARSHDKRGIGYKVKPSGWFIRSMRVNNEIYHAVEIGDEITVTYLPFTRTVRTLAVTKNHEYVPADIAIQTQQELKQSTVHGFKWAGIIIFILIVLGLGFRFFIEQNERVWREQWTTNQEETQIISLVTNSVGEEADISIEHITEFFAEGTYRLESDLDESIYSPLHTWLAKRTSATSPWMLVTTYDSRNNDRRNLTLNPQICQQYVFDEKMFPISFYTRQMCDKYFE